MVFGEVVAEILVIAGTTTMGAVEAVAEYRRNVANAIKASGAIVEVEPDDFQKIIAKTQAPLVIRAVEGRRTKKYKYLTEYKGLVFHTESRSELLLPSRVEIISAKQISVPD
jgi:hypothetical protein